MAIEFGLLIVASYLIGSIPFAYLAAKWYRGIDIRKQGTGKIGAANILSTTSKWLAIPVAIFDIGKGILTVWVAQLLGLGSIEQVTIGIITIIGHNWPIFLQFHGGRGIFTSLGVITALSPKLGLIILVIPYTLAPFKQVALGVFFGLISIPFFSWFLSQPLNIEEKFPITMGLMVLTLLCLLRRILVPRTKMSTSIHPFRLFINRLLFDRDIIDRKTWIRRTSSN